MGAASAVVSVLGTLYSAYSSERQQSKAEKAESDLEDETKARLAAAETDAAKKAEERRRRSSLYGRQSTFSAFNTSEATTGKKSLFGSQ